MANLEEKGLQTLFVAMGKGTWPATDGGRPTEAPILLVPASLETKGHGSKNFYLKRSGTVQANLVLLHVLENQFGAKLSADELLTKLLGDDEGEQFDIRPVYAEIIQKCTCVPGLEVKDFSALGNFAFQKMAMVKDLQERAQELSNHDIISAIAGDTDARSTVSSSQTETAPGELDKVPPDNEFNVLDADSSQQCAIADVLAGQPTLAEGEGLVWGECQGSGATPYRVVVNEADAGYKCTCPSRKFPCKHTLALMWMRAEKIAAFTPATVPEWVKDWLSRRRGKSTTAIKDEDEEQPKPKPSIRLTELPEAVEKPDPKAEQRAAAARERNRVECEAAVLAGLDDLDIWLSDQVQHGMATFVAQTAQACRTIAQRLVDAKASGLAGRLDALPTRLFTLPGPARPTAAIRELGQVHLISQAYRRASELPELLAADARQAVGWAITREALHSDSKALRVDAAWRVFAVLPRRNQTACAELRRGCGAKTAPIESRNARC